MFIEEGKPYTAVSLYVERERHPVFTSVGVIDAVWQPSCSSVWYNDRSGHYDVMPAFYPALSELPAQFFVKRTDRCRLRTLISGDGLVQDHTCRLP